MSKMTFEEGLAFIGSEQWELDMINVMYADDSNSVLKQKADWNKNKYYSGSSKHYMDKADSQYFVLHLREKHGVNK